MLVCRLFLADELFYSLPLLLQMESAKIKKAKLEKCEKIANQASIWLELCATPI